MKYPNMFTDFCVFVVRVGISAVMLLTFICMLPLLIAKDFWKGNDILKNLKDLWYD